MIRVARPGTNLYLSPARVGILSFIGFLTYQVWWRWQLFKFTGREAFPRAKSFWWTLVPVYGYVVIWEQLDDFKHAAANRKVRVRAGLILALLVAGAIALNLTGWIDRLTGSQNASRTLVALVVGSLLTAFGMYLGQRSVVAYLAASYPTARRRRISIGEIVATLLSPLILVLVGGLAYYGSRVDNAPADAGAAVSYLPPASPVTGAALADGSTLYRDPASRFAIQLPPNWASVAWDAAARGEKPTRLVKFYAEANDKSGDLTLMRWVRRPISLDHEVSVYQAALERSGVQALAHTRVTLPAGEAERVTYNRTYPDSSGQAVTDYFIEYLIVSRDESRARVYLMRFAIADTVTETMELTILSIVTSFRVL
jgi:hypothetical protein